MAYAFVSSFASNLTTPAPSSSASGTIAAGEYLLVAVMWPGGAGTLSITDNLGNTYTPRTFLTSNYNSQLFYCASALGGAATVTAAFTGSSGYTEMTVYRYTGLTGAPDDYQTAAMLTAPGTDGMATPNLTPVAAPAMVFGLTMSDYGGQASVGTGFTDRGVADATPDGFGRAEDKRITTTTAVAVTFTGAAGGGGATQHIHGLVIREGTAPVAAPQGWLEYLLATGVLSFAAGARAILTWQAPLTASDGTAISDLTGYKAYWGQTDGGPYPNNSGTLSSSTFTYTIPSLAAGTWFFVVSALDSAGGESYFGPQASKVI